MDYKLLVTTQGLITIYTLFKKKRENFFLIKKPIRDCGSRAFFIITPLTTLSYTFDCVPFCISEATSDRAALINTVISARQSF